MDATSVLNISAKVKGGNSDEFAPKMLFSARWQSDDKGSLELNGAKVATDRRVVLFAQSNSSDFCVGVVQELVPEGVVINRYAELDAKVKKGERSFQAQGATSVTIVRERVLFAAESSNRPDNLPSVISLTSVNQESIGCYFEERFSVLGGPVSEQDQHDKIDENADIAAHVMELIPDAMLGWDAGRE